MLSKTVTGGEVRKAETRKGGEPAGRKYWNWAHNGGGGVSREHVLALVTAAFLVRASESDIAED